MMLLIVGLTAWFVVAVTLAVGFCRLMDLIKHYERFDEPTVEPYWWREV